MRVTSLDLLLLLVTLASLFTAWRFGQDAARNRQRASHLFNLRRIAVQQRDDARRERDRAVTHAQDATALMTAGLRITPPLHLVETDAS
jgi:hypothetical protein